MFKKKKFWTEVIASDIHVPKNNKKATTLFLKALRSLSPDGITLLGDIGDWDPFSPFKLKKLPYKNYDESRMYDESLVQYATLNKFLDNVAKASPKSKLTWAHGNHEIWVDNYISGNPRARKDLFDISSRLKLKERGYKEYAYNEVFKLGKLSLLHGMYHGQNHAKQHVLAFSKSVLYGHVHDIQVYSKITVDNESHMAWSNPCLCNLNPEYLRTKPQNWNHGFTIVYKWPNGNFQVNIIRIQNGRCVVEGQEITA